MQNVTRNPPRNAKGSATDASPFDQTVSLVNKVFEKCSHTKEVTVGILILILYYIFPVL